MSVDLHRQAEHLMAQAELERDRGDLARSTTLYREAATLEEQAFHRIPRDRPRTRGIIAVSAVALYRDAGARDDALHLAHQLLALTDPPVVEAARDQLYELIADVRREQAAVAGDVRLARQVYEVSLEGGLAAAGYASLDAVSLKLQQLRNLIVRVGEWQLGEPFRRFGVLSKRVASLCSPLMSQPQFGSFRFQLRLASVRQPQLPGMETEDRSQVPDRVASQFLDLVTEVAEGRADRLAERVPDDDYRDIFVKLVRNLAPDGRDIERLRISRVAGGEARSVTMTPESATVIRNLLPSPSLAPDAEPIVEVGVLRALNLDRRFILLTQDQHREMLRFERGVIFDDVVGPFVNHLVRALGYRKGASAYVQEIVLEAEAGEDASLAPERPIGTPSGPM